MRGGIEISVALVVFMGCVEEDGDVVWDVSACIACMSCIPCGAKISVALGNTYGV